MLSNSCGTTIEKRDSAAEKLKLHGLSARSPSRYILEERQEAACLIFDKLSPSEASIRLAGLPLYQVESKADLLPALLSAAIVLNVRAMNG